MGIRFNHNKQERVRPYYGAAKRTAPKLRFLLIVLLISLPLIALMYQVTMRIFYVRFPGYVAFDTLVVRAPMAGYVKTLYVKLGSEVRDKQHLVQFVSPSLNTRLAYLLRDREAIQGLIQTLKKQQLDDLLANQQVSKADVEMSALVYERFKKHRSKGVIDELKLEDARRHYLDAKRKLAMATEAIRRAQQEKWHLIEMEYGNKLRDINNQIAVIHQQQAQLLIKSQADGNVSAIMTYENEYIDSGSELLKIVTKKNLHIVGYVAPKYIDQAVQGKMVAIAFPDGLTIKGKIYNIPNFSQRTPVEQSNPIAERGNQILILIRLEEPLPAKYHVFGVPVKIRL